MRRFFKFFLLLYFAPLLGDGVLLASTNSSGKSIFILTPEKPDSSRQVQLRAIEVEEYDYKLVSVQKWRSADSNPLLYTTASKYVDFDCDLFFPVNYSFSRSKKYILHRVFRI